MKKSVILFILAGAIIAGALVYSKKQKPAPASRPAAASEPQQIDQPPPMVAPAPKSEPPPLAATPATTPSPVAAAAPVATNTAPSEETNSIRKSVDALLSAKNGMEKHNLFLQLAKDGQLDAAIDELKQRAAANPTDAEIPATLGEALLNKVRAMHEAGNTDRNETALLAIQADQQFNAALKIDPKNWEAQYVKASSIYYWPADPQRDADAAQQLAGLIDQQETMTAQPQFAQTYAALVRQYQKMGKPEEAAATLKLALQKFPADAALQQMAAGQ